MFYYWYRLARIFVSRYFQSPTEVEEEIDRDFRVRLFDCETLRVMTASRYIHYMDYGKYEFVARSPLFRGIVEQGWAYSIGAQKVIYKRPLKIWKKFNLKVKVVGWDNKWMYHQHIFTQDGQVCAIGVSKSLVWKKGRPIPVKKCLKRLERQT